MRVVVYVCVILAVCRAYRPDGDDTKQLAVIPKGIVLHDERKVDEHQHREPVERSGLNSTQHRATHELAAQNSTLGRAVQSSRPFALEQSFASSHNRVDLDEGNGHGLNGTRVGGNPFKHTCPQEKGEHEKCAGKGDGWECAGMIKNGGDVESGHACKVKCTDEYNYMVKEELMQKPGVCCKDGSYSPEPECIERVQCENGGGGWKCEGIEEGKKLNEGMICHVACAEPDFIVVGAKATCEGGQLVAEKGSKEEPGCRQAKHCKPKGGEGEEGWECKGEAGGEEVPHGHTCQMECDDKKLHASHATLTCHDGEYTEEPSCSAAPPPSPTPKGFAAFQCGRPMSSWMSLTLMLVVILYKLDV